MREILFRGKQAVNKEWVYGDLIHCPNGFFMSGENADFVLIDKKTLGQYTGLCDKNGKKIFEGDILLINDEKEYPVYATFDDFRFVCHSKKCSMYRHTLENIPKQYEVIGNIYDNPELLEG